MKTAKAKHITITGSFDGKHYQFMVYRPKHIPNDARWPRSCGLFKYWFLKPLCKWNNTLDIKRIQQKPYNQRAFAFLQKWLHPGI